jgi:hypothetical protein
MAQDIPEDRVTRLDMAIEKLGASALAVAEVAASRPGCSSNCSNASKAALAAEEVAISKSQK